MPSHRAPAPAPIKTTPYYYDAPTTTQYYDSTTTRRPTEQPAADVVDTASWSPPSTPSDSSSASSPHVYHHQQQQQQPMLPRQVPAPPCVEVRQVWHHNFTHEAALIESLLPRFRYAAVDTEFPGTVYRPACPAYLLTQEKRYALLKANVDALHVIQLGLTLFNDSPSPTTAKAAIMVWEFNLREFDASRHRHAPESVAMLRARGVDLARLPRHGVHASSLGPRLRRWLTRAPGLARAGLVTFSGGYDVAYLLKAMFGCGYKLPSSPAEFEAVAGAVLRRRSLFDVKEMARRCGADLRGGLDRVAAKLGVARAVGEAHQAGSDSLLTCHAFLRMKELYFDDEDKLARVAGVITGINDDAPVDVVM